MALVVKFNNSGQSGGSAPYVASALSEAIKKLCLQQSICDITGIDEEWNSCAYAGDSELFQNNRDSAVFKEGVSGRPYYLDAIIFRDERGMCYSGNSTLLKDGSTIASRQYAKVPFKPKSFYIDVISKEIAIDDWEFTVKDEEQFREVFEYYEK